MDSSKVNYEKLRQNLDLAMDVYIDRVDNSPCGAGSIKLFKGADSSSNQEIRKYLLQFLNGNKAQKKQLQEEHQEVYDYLEKVWNIRNDHMLPNIPTQYCFVLICCMKSHCAHPVCKTGKNPHHSWYEGGPLVNSVPCQYLIQPDPGAVHARSVRIKVIACHGHFLSPAYRATTSTLSPMAKPPSLIIKESFKENEGKLHPTCSTHWLETVCCQSRR